MSFTRTLDRYRRGDGDRFQFWRGEPPTDLAQVVSRFVTLSPAQMHSAVRFLGELKDQRAVPVLARLLPTFDPDSAQLAAQTIATIGGPEACPALLEALAATHAAATRAAAVYALTWLIDDRAYVPLLQIWQDRTEPAAVRIQAAEGVTYLADNQPRFSPRWQLAVASFIVGLEDPDPDLRFSSVAALGALRVEEAIAPLRKLAESERTTRHREISLRQEALEAIDRILHGQRHPAGAA